MGAGASAILNRASGRRYGRGEVVVRTRDLHQHVRVYQHFRTGEVVVVLDFDSAAFFTGAHPRSEYQRIYISNYGLDYLKNIRLAVSSPEEGKRSLEGDGSQIEELITQEEMSDSNPNIVNSSIHSSNAGTIVGHTSSQSPSGPMSTELATSSPPVSAEVPRDTEAKKTNSPPGSEAAKVSPRYRIAAGGAARAVRALAEAEAPITKKTENKSIMSITPVSSAPDPSISVNAPILHKQSETTRNDDNLLPSLGSSTSQLPPVENKKNSPRATKAREDAMQMLSSQRSIISGPASVASSVASAAASIATSDHGFALAPLVSTHISPRAVSVKSNNSIENSTLATHTVRKKRRSRDTVLHNSSIFGVQNGPANTSLDDKVELGVRAPVPYLPPANQLTSLIPRDADGTLSNANPDSHSISSKEQSSSDNSTSAGMPLTQSIASGVIGLAGASTAIGAGNTPGRHSQQSQGDTSRSSHNYESNEIGNCPYCKEIILGVTAEAMYTHPHVVRCKGCLELKQLHQDANSALAPLLKVLNDTASDPFKDTLQAEDRRFIHNTERQVRNLIHRVMKFDWNLDAGRISSLNDSIISLKQKIEDHQQKFSQKGDGTAPELTINVECERLLSLIQEINGSFEYKCNGMEKYGDSLLQLSDITFKRAIGRGSYSTVYMGRRADTNKKVAIKVVDKHKIKEGKLIPQILAEKRTLAMARKYPDYFVQLQCTLQSKTELFFVLEYVAGGDCLSLITTLKQLNESVVMHLISQVCLAVKFLHRHGVIHRDIKADNVVITDRGHAKLCDFGSVMAVEPDSSQYPIPTQRVKKNGDLNATIADFILGDFEYEDDTKGFVDPSNSENAKNIGFTGHMKGGRFSNRSTPDSKNAGSEGGSDEPNSGVEHKVNTSSSTRSTASRWLVNSSSKPSDSISEPDTETASTHNTCQSQDASSEYASSGSLFFPKIPGQRNLQSVTTIVGNVHYVSPEIAGGTGDYSRSSDWWSVGVLTFHLLAGVTPFEGENKASTLENIEQLRAEWGSMPPTISTNCDMFIRAIIEHYAESRLGTLNSAEVFLHPFFSGVNFSTLYHGYGQYYPQQPIVADETSREYWCHTTLSDDDSRSIPDHLKQIVVKRPGQHNPSAVESSTGGDNRLTGKVSDVNLIEPTEESMELAMANAREEVVLLESDFYGFCFQPDNLQ